MLSEILRMLTVGLDNSYGVTKWMTEIMCIFCLVTVVDEEGFKDKRTKGIMFVKSMNGYDIGLKVWDHLFNIKGMWILE